MTTALEDLQWKKIPVLDQGFVTLVDAMGDDRSIVQAARTSYGNEGQEKTQAEDETLLRYLMRHHHTTPFEMCELKFLIMVPMDCWRQFVRHRTASINEYSTRYTNAIDAMATTKPDDWRLQSTSNKQGSSGYLRDWPNKWQTDEGGVFCPPHAPIDTNRCNIDTPGEYLTHREEMFHDFAKELYQERLEAGVAKEQARKDLPLSNYTRAFWKVDLHNLLHFLRLRLDSHAQYEIRQFANAIADIVQALFPATWRAFLDYRLNAVTLSGPEVTALADVNNPNYLSLEDVAEAHFGNKRERSEFIAKAERLKIDRHQWRVGDFS